MILLRYQANKMSGAPSGEYWYVANEFADGTFTITMNRKNALQFSTEEAADAFNQRQVRLGHITAPFEIKTL